jgi:SRSO17 transposase
MPTPHVPTATLLTERLASLGWLETQEQFFASFAAAFTPRGSFHARAYLLGLLLPGERKSIQPMAARLGVDYDPLQWLISESSWQDQQVLQPLRRLVQACAARYERCFIFDDTGFPKQGKHSVGVQRQYSGSLGKIGNCQIAVGLIYGWGNAHFGQAAPVGWRLYLPESWAQDPERRKQAGIPPEVCFRTKYELALELLDAGLQDGLTPQFVLADSWYGESHPFRRGLRQRQLPYAAALVPKRCQVLAPEVPVGLAKKRLRILDDSQPLAVTDILVTLPEEDWTLVKWREGQKPLWGWFHRRPVRVMEEGFPSDELADLVLERCPDGELKAYLVWGMDALSLEAVVERIHRRWLVEQVFQQTKEELGLDHFEGRSWRGWHHHVTLVTAAYILLTLHRPPPPDPPADGSPPSICRPCLV